MSQARPLDVSCEEEISATNDTCPSHATDGVINSVNKRVNLGKWEKFTLIDTINCQSIYEEKDLTQLAVKNI